MDLTSKMTEEERGSDDAGVLDPGGWPCGGHIQNSQERQQLAGAGVSKVCGGICGVDPDC